MRLAYDAASMLGRRTGVGHYAATLLEELETLALERDGALDVSLFAFTRLPADALAPDLRARLRHVRVPARLVVNAWEVVARVGGGRPALGGARGFDVVHGTNFWVPPQTRRNGVVTVHDLTFLRHPEWCTPQVRRYRTLLPPVLRRCGAVLTPSVTGAEHVAAELGVERDRVVATPLGVRSTFVGAVPDGALLQRLGVRGDYLLFLGTREPRKNLPRLLRAYAASGLREVQLVLAGPDGWGEEDLGALAGSLGVADRVRTTGYLTDAEAASLVSGARAFVFPTLYEGFGLPPLEAMAAGVPVVATRADPLPEILGEAPFWCDPLDVDSIAAALVEAVSDEQGRAARVEAGLRQAARYDWRRTAELTLAAYDRVAEEAGVSRRA